MQSPGSREELVALLAKARKARGISIRRASTLVALPASTVQGWFEGKHLPTHALTPKFLELLGHLGLTADDDAEERWLGTIAALRTMRTIAETPYAGLGPYTPDQANLYFGREQSLRKLVEACLRPTQDDAARVVFLLGESGSGKTSLLAAGLIGGETAPGGALHHLKPMRIGPGDIATMKVPTAPTLLVVDQFEDLDRLDSAAQREAMARLSALPASVVCVIGLRADAIGLAMRDEWLSRDLSSPVVLGPVSQECYVRIIEQPSLRHGRSVSPELTQLLLRDIKAYGEPAAGVVLPLLSSVLRRCWENSSGGVLTPADYFTTGGLWSALNREADSIYESFSPAQQETARRLLLSLLNVDGTAALRRRIPVAALTPEMASVAEPFVASRILLRIDEQLEVAHDALLLHWRRLAEWVEGAQATLLLGRRIHLAAQLWDEGGRTRDALMPAEAQLWRAWADSDEATVLSRAEHDFIDASCAEGEAALVEQRHTISRIRRRQNIALVAGGLAVAMAVAAVFASFRSEDYRRQGEATTRAAQSRQIALISDEVRSTSANLAGQLSVAAYALDDNVQTRSSVLTSAAAGVPARATGPTGNTMVAVSADARLIVRAASDGVISIWRDGTLTPAPTTVHSDGAQLFALSLRQSGGSDQVIVGGQRTAAVWDITDKPRKLTEFGADTVGYSASWQGDVAMVGTLEGTVRRVDLSDPETPKRLPDLTIGAETAVTGLASNDRFVLAGGRRDRIEVFDRSGAALAPLSISGTVLGMAASPDGDQFVAGSTAREATLWDGATLRRLLTVPTSSVVNSVAHLGDSLLVAGAFGAVEEYDTTGGLLGTFPGRSTVTSVSGSGASVVAGSSEGETSQWGRPDLGAILNSPEGVIHYDVIRSDAGLLIGTDGGAVMMTDTPRGWEPIPIEPAPGGARYNAYYAIDAAGERLVNQTDAGELVTLTLRDGTYRVTGTQPMPTGLVDIQLSPDGNLLAVGYRGQAGYRLYRADQHGWSEVERLDGWPSSSSFNADGTMFACMTHDGKGFNLWQVDGETPRLVSTSPSDRDTVPISFSFAPDGALAIGDDAGIVAIYDLAEPSSPRRTALLGDARSSLSQLQFSEDGGQLLAASRSGDLWVWQRGQRDWTLNLMLRPGGDMVTGVDTFAGKFVMSLDDGRTVAWEDDPVVARGQLCAGFGAPLTEEEWQRLVPGVAFIDGCKPR